MSVPWAFAIVNVLAFAPEMAWLFLYHCKTGVGKPAMPAVKVAVSPTFTVWLAGCGEIAGVKRTLKVAELVALPAILDAITETGRPSSANGTLFNVSEDPVAPATLTPLVYHC